MRRLIVKYKSKPEVTIYKIVSFKTGKKHELLGEDINNFCKSPSIESFEIVDDSVQKQYHGNSVHKVFESKYEKENNKLPISIAKEVIKCASTSKGCTKQNIDRWNKVLDFDLHSKLNGKYGFSGAKRLYNIFSL